MKEVLCIVHDDGHVCAVSTSILTDERVRFDYEVMVRMGITGWRLEKLELEKALTAELGGIGCETCHIVMSCGCGAERVAHGHCHHGTAKQIRKVGREIKAGAS